MPLVELTVVNLAVVERVRLPLSRGFTVLTGETGAGKSLVVDAVALALGARAAADQVRTGTDAARVEAVFDAPERRADDAAATTSWPRRGGVAIVRREVGADGRSSARVNDRAVTVGGLGGARRRGWRRSTASTSSSASSSRRGSSPCSTDSAAHAAMLAGSGRCTGRGARRWPLPRSC